MKKNKRQDFILQSGAIGAGLCMGIPLVSKAEAMADDATWKWSKKARYYTETARGIKCNLCPNNCVLQEGEMGDCRNRMVQDNVLYSIAYGNPVGAHLDPVEKKPLLHFYPGSTAFSIGCSGCNMACLNCQNWEISQRSPFQTAAINLDLMPASVIEKSTSLGAKSIAYTYTEPFTFYEYMTDTAVLAKEKGIKNILVSNGYIHEQPLKDLIPFLDAANIDLKSFDNNIYMKLNGATLSPVLRTLTLLKDRGVWLEITNLVIPSWTDKMDMIATMCDWLVSNGFENNPLHFSRFFPMYRLSSLPVTPVDTLKEAQKIARDKGMKYVYIGNVPGNENETTICNNCGKELVQRNAFRITANVIRNSRCPYCNEEIPGVWS